MRLPKTIVGKHVRVKWMDPRGVKFTTGFADLRDIPKGRELLATWEEWGKVDDITDGVLRLVQSFAMDPPSEEHRQYDIHYSAIPEVLIESIVIMEDQVPADPPAPSPVKETA